MKTTTKTTMTIAIIALIVAMATVTQSQTVDAWHSTYPTKKDCVHFMMDIHQQSLSQAQDSCKNNIPH
ncbi:MAG: hypothetical protein ACRD97_11235 [Nitrososphaeraceae archaeon]|jgi:hypothetical protein